MIQLRRYALCAAISGVAIFCIAQSHLNFSPNSPVVSAAVAQAQDQSQVPDPGPDPAAVNQAPGDNSVAPSGPSYTTQAPPPPPDQAGAPDQNPEDDSYAEQPTATAPDAPPPLPDYDQPPPPSDGYVWTPGYWAWAPTGYYWVPGAWVEPPYVGALWTPGYWGFYGGRYMFYPGHWGLHIGFYGGINYGFGYVGFGYEGGYWNGGHFFYNRVYNNINVRAVHNVYSYRAVNRTVVNRTVVNREVNNVRPSYRGGPGGVQAHPQPAERAAYNEPYAPRMSTQVQHAENYAAVRGQYASENHGKPPSPAISRPLPADHNVQPQPRNSGGGGHRR
jgi:hypothetical protein